MRFGLALPSYSFADLDYAKAARLRDFAAEAEARGYESLWGSSTATKILRGGAGVTAIRRAPRQGPD